MDTVKTFIVWLFFLLIPVEDQEKFHFLQLVGFILVVVANIIYSEILEIPFFELNKYTKKNLEKMENEKHNSLISDKSNVEEENIVSNRESEVDSVK